MAGLVDGRLQFLKGELLRFGIAAVGENGAAGENLDVVGAIVSQLANDLADFPRTVGLAIVEVPRERDVRRQAGGRAGPAGDGDVSARHEHAWANDVTAVDGVAQSDVGEGTIDSDVANGGETRFEHGTRVGNGFESNLRAGFPELDEGIGIAGAIGEMSMTVDEAGKNRRAGEIHDLSPIRN